VGPIYTQALSHSDKLDAVLKGTNSTAPHSNLFEIVLNLMPSGLSDPAKVFGAVIISVLVSLAGYVLWRNTFWRDGRWRS
jgi:hypothetical protein